MNMAYRFKTVYKQLLAHTTTPVSTALRLRYVFPNSLLLECSDYHSRENNMSYLCCQPIAGIKLDRNTLEIQYPGLPATRKPAADVNLRRSEERRVGKECVSTCRSRW